MFNYIKKEYTLEDITFSLIGLYPGMNSEIFRLVSEGHKEAIQNGLTGKDAIDYADSYAREYLD